MSVGGIRKRQGQRHLMLKGFKFSLELVTILICSQSPRHAGELWLEGRLGNLLNGITLLQINLGQRTTALQIGDKS